MSARPPQGSRSGRGGARPDLARRDAVHDLLAPVVSALGLELEDVELRSAGRRQILRVLVDSAGGITLDEVATASTAVSAALDDVDVLGDEPYTLEVSSPGVDRPLTLPRHWQRNVGRLVAVTLLDGTQVTGRVRSVDGADVALELSVKGRTSTRTIALAEVKRAVVEVEFARTVDAADGATDTTDDVDVDVEIHGGNDGDEHDSAHDEDGES